MTLITRIQPRMLGIVQLRTAWSSQYLPCDVKANEYQLQLLDAAHTTSWKTLGKSDGRQLPSYGASTMDRIERPERPISCGSDRIATTCEAGYDTRKWVMD